MKLKDLKLGATGEFPYGRAGADDEGELRMAVAADRQSGIIRIIFGKPVGWLGLPVGEARALAELLLKKADELEKVKT